ncbi:MAG: mannose-6-phosphate isomerase [Mariniblastus sp.]|jgi:mannose-6-phosphate isomerase
MYPLRFEPLFKRYIWGGQRLASVLGKPIGTGNAAESWEVSDHQEDQSVVRFGELAGQTLRQLIAAQGTELVGEALLAQITAPDVPAHLQNRFPLLFKFLDANRPLSVQVHPNDSFGATLAPPDLGKTEAWYVMHADRGAKIFAGLKQGVTAEGFREAIQRGETELMLHSFEPQAGDCVFIPAGTMHAIGAGLLVAEIQQASNTTFRVYDWDRVDQQGVSRPLHIEQAIEVTDFARGPVDPESTSPTGRPGWEQVVACEKFIMNRADLSTADAVGGDGRFRILAVTNGEMMLAGDPSGLPVKLGETVLLPACLGKTALTPGEGGVEFLEISVPDAS